ncbi:MAG: threonine ammonia-lyase, biosynthetic, partial [Gammaproteobacteria bacterium]|nr:threonine ammonia-lyase, biosynthetic [Gammaproteobacteria bacterium]
NANVYLKREDLLPIFSFKLRGAYNMIAHLSQKERERGIIAASAGNHAQGVAMAASKCGIKATIVMPVTTPATKVNSVRSYKVNLILKGDSFQEAFAHTQSLVKKFRYIYIPPFDHPLIIAGQGTVGAEIIRQQQQQLDAIFVPVGGGGLLAGIGAYIKYIKPSVKIIGVEPEDAASMTVSLKNKKITTLSDVGLFADGVAVDRVGNECFKIAKNCVDEMITVTTDEICAATKDVFEDTRVLAEPAGALALAGVRKFCAKGGKHDGQHLVSILSGANTDFDRLRHIAERTDIGEQREGLFAVTIPEKPGSFLNFCRLLSKYSITEFNYRYSYPQQAQIFVGIRINSKNDIGDIIRTLKKNDYSAYDMTANEMAKLHIRHMVGGIPPSSLDNEMIFRFEFPERPGALLKFLRNLNPKWNISLFNYRNHGAAYGRVLAGLQVPHKERGMLKKYLDSIGYKFYPENDNISYDLFLQGKN